MGRFGENTIFALASAAGRAGVAVVRVSGPEARAVTAEIAGFVPEHRQAHPARFRDPDTGEILDKGLAVFFAGPRSFTGEDVAELHLHGGRAVIDGMLSVLGRRSGLRLAEPGEFTRRAFENGKIDLTEVEGIADLIAAETAAQRRQAIRQLEGEIGRIYENWRERVVRALAHLEAEIDFADDDLGDGIRDRVQAEIGAVLADIEAHLEDRRRGEILRDGISIVILGPPNAGKSTLLNTLARRDVAITSTVAGTTRDVIEAHLDLGGYPVIVADTAGLRESPEPVEREGIRRARERGQAADLRIFLFDATEREAIAGLYDPADEDTLLIANKIDLLEDRAGIPKGVLPLSLRDGDGMGQVLARLEEMVRRKVSGEAPAVIRARHREALRNCAGSLRRALGAALPELSAEDLRLAARALGRVTGRVDVEELLDVIFRDFCIGK